MGRLIINELGPIERCELDCSQFITLTGPQASGKSTIAKAIYFFRTIKDDILNLAKTQALGGGVIDGMETAFDTVHGTTLRKGLENFLRDKFLSTFGSSWGMSNEMFMEYHFTDTCSVRISLMEETKFNSPNYIWITLSSELKKFLGEKDRCFIATPLGVSEDEIIRFKNELFELFHDKCHVVYIPAGRSMSAARIYLRDDGRCTEALAGHLHQRLFRADIASEIRIFVGIAGSDIFCSG